MYSKVNTIESDRESKVFVGVCYRDDLILQGQGSRIDTDHRTFLNVKVQLSLLHPGLCQIKKSLCFKQGSGEYNPIVSVEETVRKASRTGI
jgi:hypothetical protein